MLAFSDVILFSAFAVAFFASDDSDVSRNDREECLE